MIFLITIIVFLKTTVPPPVDQYFSPHQNFLSQPISTPLYFTPQFMSANQKILLPLLSMTAYSSEAKRNDGALHYPGPLSADAPSFCHGPKTHRSKDATPNKGSHN